jgi:uncharacterized protein (DUF362 family)
MTSKVFVAKTSPSTVIADYQKLLRSADYKKSLDLDVPIVIKINLSWTKFYPACSTPPWQLEGIVKTLLEDGFPASQIIPVENRTVVTNVQEGSVNNGWVQVLKKYGLKMTYLTDVAYKIYKPKHKLLVMDKIFPDGIELPEIIFGANVIHLPTMKMHVFTTNTGAIKNYFGMLRTIRHFAHRHIHETIIDLLTIQKEIHPGIFAVMDGTVVGSGSGPRAMQWEEKNYILASSDCVAIDAIAAKMMGFNPLQIKYLKLGKKLGLGECDPQKIEVVGADISKVNFGYKQGDTLASRGQKLLYHHTPPWFEKLLLQTVIAPWSYLASTLYHDVYWYNFVGRPRIAKFFKTGWGKLFQNYLKN